MAQSTLEKYQQYNLFRSPSWRWERVMQLVDRAESGRRKRTSWQDDKYIKEAAAFVLNYRRADEERRPLLFEQNPGLFYAYEIICHGDEEWEMVLQARLLTGEPDEEIAKMCGTLPETIKWYEALMYNVRDRLQDRKANRDWIVRTVMGATSLRTLESKAFAITAKLFGYFAGVDVLNDYLAQTRVPITRPKTAKQVDEFYTAHRNYALLKRTSAAAMFFEVNKYNIMQLLEIAERNTEFAQTNSASQQLSSTDEALLAMFDDEIWRLAVHSDSVVLPAADLRAEEILNPDIVIPALPERLPPPRKKTDEKQR